MKVPSQSHGLKRRLGAALFADVVNYARLMSQDEVGTHAAVKSRFRIFAELSKAHHGEIVQIRGDGVFLLFESAIDSACFALEVQKAMRTENLALAEDKQLVFRIGIHCGEILFDEDGVSGDSVNIAARIEQMAPPGSVCVSATVYEQIRNKVVTGFEYLGSKPLKNIEAPVDLFVLREDTQSAAMTPGLRHPIQIGRDNLTQDHSVVVLPFKSQGDEGSESWLADGLTEDITTNLSRFHNLFVIARSSAFIYREREISPQEAGRSLGVRYVICGTIRKAGNRIRITIQLMDAVRDRTIWGEHYDRQLDDIFEIQDEITEIIVSATAVQIEASERERARTLPPSDLLAYGFVLQGQQHMFQYKREANRTARELYEAALKADPIYARALAAKSRTLNIDWRYDWADSSELALDEALMLALKATEVDERDARGFGELGFSHLYRKEHDAAISSYKRALLLNPNDADLMSDMADAMAHSGQSEDAIALLEKAMRLNPFYPDQYLWHLGGAYYNIYRYEDAIRAIQSMQNPTEGRRVLAAAYAQLGRLDEARDQAQKVLRAHPGFSIARWSSVVPDRLPADVAHYAEGLKKSGLPD